jgi:hypothetical protein
MVLGGPCMAARSTAVGPALKNVVVDLAGKIRRKLPQFFIGYHPAEAPRDSRDARHFPGRVCPLSALGKLAGNA